MEANGFTIKSSPVPNTRPVRERLRVPESASACHTAVIGDYVIEGHVSAEEIFRLLKETPDIIGLAAPDMPKGAPGMEGPDAEPYDVLELQPDGTTTIYARHGIEPDPD